MSEPSSADSKVLIQQALVGDARSVRELVDMLSPVISKRVTATLWQRTRRRNVVQEVADMSQDVFVSLFQSDGKALRAWDPARGMSLDRFVGMLAQHQVISILRNGRTSPWREEPMELADLDEHIGSPTTPEAITTSRQDLRALLDRLREKLSPRGMELFQRVIIDEEPLASLMETTGLGRDAIYQWKSRLLKIIRDLAGEIDSPGADSSKALSEKAAGLRIVKGAPQT